MTGHYDMIYIVATATFRLCIVVELQQKIIALFGDLIFSASDFVHCNVLSIQALDTVLIQPSN